MKTAALSLAVAAIISFTAPAALAGGGNDVLYQVSSIGALEQGGFDGMEYVSGVLQNGGFGIGTFEGLDGEMVVLDGKCYQVLPDGKVYTADNNTSTPFADVTFFEPDITKNLSGQVDLDMLEEFIDAMLPNDGLIYAVKVTGRFGIITVSAASAQNKPYPALSVALKGQKEFTKRAVNGTLVGFRFPGYMGGGLNAPGYHFHFMSEELDFGGHVVSCGINSGKVEADATDQLFVVLPETGWTTPEEPRNEVYDQLEKDLKRLEDEERAAQKEGGR